MDKSILWLIALVISLSFGFASCAEDTTVEDPYADWQTRNDRYLDSIADVARTNRDGKWMCVQNYKIWDESLTSVGGGITVSGGSQYERTDTVYIHFLEYGPQEGKAAEFTTDSVSVYYYGTLINGERFDGNYQGDWDSELTPQIYSPTTFCLGGLVSGWQTALMPSHDGTYEGMKPGDRVDLFVPYQMAYGSSGMGNIRGYSVLRFHMRLEEIIHPKGPDGRSRAALPAIAE